MPNGVNLMKQELLTGLQYSIFQGSGALEPSIPSLHNASYSFWKSFWESFYRDAGSESSFSADNFHRQDFVTILARDHEIAAMHLYSLFRLDHLSDLDHKYLAPYPKDFFPFMEKHQATFVLSLEYLTVAPNWRKNICGVSLGEVLIGCGLRVMSEMGAHAVIAPARADEKKVNEMAYRYGFDCFESGLKMLGCPIDIVVGFKGMVKESPDPEIAQWVDRYWAKRRDYTASTLGRTNVLAA